MFLGRCTLLFLRPVTAVFNPRLYLQSIIIDKPQIKVLTEPFKSFISAEQFDCAISHIAYRVSGWLCMACQYAADKEYIDPGSVRI